MTAVELQRNTMKVSFILSFQRKRAEQGWALAL